MQEKPRAVVVAVDPARLELYARTLRLAEVPNLATLDLDEAEQLLIQHQPTVLVLDHGLPRVYILRLYGLVREVMDGPRVKVLFVGQEARADSSPDDFYLPGEPSPLGVAAEVCELVADADQDAASEALPAHAGAAAGSLSSTATGESRDSQAEPASEGAAAEPPRKRRRLDVLMFRVGLLLLILGGLVAFIRPESFSLPMSVPPREAPTPAPAPPTQQPAASPSPAAILDLQTLPSHVVA